MLLVSEPGVDLTCYTGDVGIFSFLKGSGSTTPTPDVGVVLTVPNDIKSTDKVIRGLATVTNRGTLPATVLSIEFSLHSNHDDELGSSNRTLSSETQQPPFVLQPGQSQQVPLELPYAMGDAVADALQKGNPQLGQYADTIAAGVNMLSKLANVADAAQHASKGPNAYRLEASVKLEGTSARAIDKTMIDIQSFNSPITLNL